MKEKLLLKIQKNKIDILWIILILTLTIGIRFSPLVLNDFSKSYNTVFADASYIPYTNDPGDSYYYARRIRDFAEGENPVQPLSRAGVDKKMITLSEKRDEAWTRNLFPIIGAFFLKICNLFGISNLLTVGTIYEAFLIGLAASLLYLFIKNRTNRFGGVAAAVLLTCGTPVLVNTNWGHCDTDGILVLLPMAMMFSFYKSLEMEDKKSRIKWSLISCLMYMMICLSWTSYNVYYLVFLGVGLATVLGSFLLKPLFPSRIVMVVMAQILINTVFSLIMDGKRFVDGLLNLFGATSGGIGNGVSGYPSASMYISELLKLSWVSTEIEQIFDTTVGTNINMLGGIAVVLLTVFTVVVLLVMCVRKRKTEEERFRTIGLQAMIFIPWLVATIVMLSQGRRFLEYILMPVSVLFGLGLGYLIEYIRKNELNFVSSSIIYAICLIVVVGTFMSSGLMLGVVSFVVIIFCAAVGRNKYKNMLIVLLTGALIITPVNGAYKASKSYKPGITSIYYDTAEWIEKNTPENALIASWWDYGYFFQCYGKRATIGHGGVFDGQYFYWLARGLFTSDYKLSAGIFRMLGNGGLSAQNILTEMMMNPEKECEVLEKILPESKEEAFRILTKECDIPKERANQVVNKTHASDGKPIYLVITQDMFAKLYGIAYYGTWDFKKGNTKYYYVTSSISRHVEPGETAQVNMTGNGTNISKVSYAVDEKDRVIPHVYDRNNHEIIVDRHILIENGKIVSDEAKEHAKNAVIVFKENNYYSSICCTADFCDSVMFKLFYTDATEQNSYTKVFSTEISDKIFGDHSMIQHRICCPGLKTYLGAASVYETK